MAIPYWADKWLISPITPTKEAPMTTHCCESSTEGYHCNCSPCGKCNHTHVGGVAPPPDHVVPDAHTAFHQSELRLCRNAIAQLEQVRDMNERLIREQAMRINALRNDKELVATKRRLGDQVRRNMQMADDLGDLQVRFTKKRIECDELRDEIARLERKGNQ